MLNSILANVIAGLGLFFTGLRMVDANLRQVTGRRLRTIVGRLTSNTWVAGLVGVAMGALVQSSSGILFILVSLVTSGLTTVRKALPIITWANVGCCVLIFAAVLDLRLAILYLIGLAGVAFAFDRSHKSDALGAAFGIGMLFYGIELMKAGVDPLKEQMERLTRLQSQLSLIVYLEDSMRALISITESVPSGGRLADLASAFVEGLDFVLMTAVEALESEDRESLDLLIRITGDRGDMVERIRQEYLTDEASVGTADRSVLLQLTSVYERIIWMTQRLARLVDGGRPVSGGVPVGADSKQFIGSEADPLS